MNFSASLPGFKNSRPLVWLYLLCTVLVYILLQEKYRPYDSDDPWPLSFAYNYLHLGITSDLTYGAEFGINGVKYFGKAYSVFVGKTMDQLGWTKLNAHLISMCFVTAALVMWAKLLGRLGYAPDLTSAFFLSALLSEPFFSTATSSRSDGLVFFLAALSLYEFIRCDYFLSMAITGLAFETHPMGCIAFIYIGAYLLSFPAARQKLFENRFQNFLKLSSGLVLAALFYCSLHLDALPGLLGVLVNNNYSLHRTIQNFLFDYFFETKYFRHIPELAVFLFCLVYLLSKKTYRQDPFPIVLVFLLLAFTFIERRPNFKYIIYCYPAFLLLSLKTFEALWSLRAFLLASLFLWMPQYGYAYYLNRNFDFGREIRELKQAVPHDDLAILGGCNEWFAFYDRRFFISDYQGNFEKLGLKSFYLIEEDHFRESDGESKKFILKNYSEQILQDLPINGQHFILKLESRKVQ